MTEKHISAKKAWGNLSERARLGETFGFIACLGLFYKSGAITREEVLARLNDARITRADLVKFREHTSHHQSGPIRPAIGAVGIPETGPQTGREDHRSEGIRTDAPPAPSNVFELPLRP